MFKQLFIPFIFLIIIATTGFIIYRMMKPKEKRFSTKKTYLHLAFLLYMCGVAAITIVPSQMSKTGFSSSHLNFKPLIATYRGYFVVQRDKDPDETFNYYGNLFGNILLFIPYGFFLSMLYKKSFWQVFFIAAISSCLIEFIQYLNMFLGYYRYVDIDDVILNTLGGITGFWLFKLLVRCWKTLGDIK